jgi:hypothetical protein
LQGDESQHASLRQRVVQFMCDHEGDFAPFVEDDQGFGAYSRRMLREGTWAGHMELQAASLLLGANVCIHQVWPPAALPLSPGRSPGGWGGWGGAMAGRWTPVELVRRVCQTRRGP